MVGDGGRQQGRSRARTAAGSWRRKNSPLEKSGGVEDKTLDLWFSNRQTLEGSYFCSTKVNIGRRLFG